MKTLLMLVIAGVVIPAEVAAQSGDQPAIAVSAVDKISPQVQPLAGTLFFDPIQRVRMDHARKQPVAVSDGDGDGINSAPTTSVVNGFVKRSDEKITVWVDGQMRNDVRSQAAQVLQPEDVGGASTSIKVFDTGKISKLSSKPVKPKSAKKWVTLRKAAKRPAKK